MKIKQLDVAGFRSLKNVSWQPGNLNIVIGQNGTGKSNLLRVFELISAAAQGKLSKYIQDNGGLNAIAWDGVASSVSFNLMLGDNKTSDWHESYQLEIASRLLPSSYFIKRESWVSQGKKFKTNEQYREIHIDRIDSPLGGSGKRLLFRDEEITSEGVSEKETLLSLLNSLSFAAQKKPFLFRDIIRQPLAGYNIYHDLDVGQKSKIRQAAVTRLEKRIEVDGQNLVPVLHTLYMSDRNFKRNIDNGMISAFGKDYEEIVFPPAADQQVQFRIRWKSLRREQSAADLSDGTLRFLLLLAILATPEPPSLIAIDEPETGLHPTMLPIIAEFAHEASLRTQVIFTTHSPQFLDAFTDTKPTTTVAKWENGETSLHVLDGEELDYWVREYSLGTLFRQGDLEALA
ncbi:MAG: AAA family ATPase [Acidobacteriota bacterium]